MTTEEIVTHRPVADLLTALAAAQARVNQLCICCGRLGKIKASDDGRTLLCVPCAIVAMGLKDER